MRDDLLFASTAIDWTESNLPSFEARMQGWLDENIQIGVREIEENPTHNLIIAYEEEPLPLAFSVEAGAYINTIRSAFDMLATALAYRHDMPDRDNVYFPVAKSEAAFIAGDYKGANFVKRLPPTDHAIIKAIKPYKGGDDALFTLHHLDIMRKHRRLLTVDTRPLSFHVNFMGARGLNFIPIRGQVGANGESALGFLPKAAHNPQFYLSPIITINEASGVWPLVAALRNYIALTRVIIAKFDT